MDNEENLEILKNYINEKIEKEVKNTLDLTNIRKVNYYMGYIKALEDLKDFLGIKEEYE
jgi:hypothetical protein